MKIERLKRQWSQTQLAARAALSASDVSKFESGRMVPYPAQAKRLANVLGLSPSELLDDAAGAVEMRSARR
jgi:ribosome-binding protein aMBF1 (putative translation factor)